MKDQEFKERLEAELTHATIRADACLRHVRAHEGRLDNIRDTKALAFADIEMALSTIEEMEWLEVEAQTDLDGIVEDLDHWNNQRTAAELLLA